MNLTLAINLLTLATIASLTADCEACHLSPAMPCDTLCKGCNTELAAWHDARATFLDGAAVAKPATVDVECPDCDGHGYHLTGRYRSHEDGPDCATCKGCNGDRFIARPACHVCGEREATDCNLCESCAIQGDAAFEARFHVGDSEGELLAAGVRC